MSDEPRGILDSWCGYKYECHDPDDPCGVHRYADQIEAELKMLQNEARNAHQAWHNEEDEADRLRAERDEAVAALRDIKARHVHPERTVCAVCLRIDALSLARLFTPEEPTP